MKKWISLIVFSFTAVSWRASEQVCTPDSISGLRGKIKTTFFESYAFPRTTESVQIVFEGSQAGQFLYDSLEVPEIPTQEGWIYTKWGKNVFCIKTIPSGNDPWATGSAKAEITYSCNFIYNAKTGAAKSNP